MSTTIDEKVVQMKFDSHNFETGVTKAIEMLTKLHSVLNASDTPSGLDKIQSSASKIDMSTLSNGVQNVTAKFSTMQVVGMEALRKITDKAISSGKRITTALSTDRIRGGYEEYELKMDSLKTIMASTGESIDSVNSYLNQLNTYSDKTIYSFSDMTQNIGKFTNAGVSLKDSVAAIQGISNEAAVSGANANEASRAMYNFAQALSAGSVKLIDWKSIENANMATKEFKEQLIQTAVAEGTLVKKNGEYKSTTTNAQGAVSDLFTSTKGFNDSLSHQWMTTDVLTKTLAKYADETTKIGKKASDAATKVTKFTQLIGTVKEAIESGWGQTFEIIFGDLNEATKMYTKVSKVIGDIVSNSADKRNHLLEGVFGDSTSISEWNMLKKAGADTKAFRKELQKTAEAHGVDVKKMIKSSGSFEKSLDNNWLTTEMLNETFKKFGAGTTNLTKKQKENIKAAGKNGDALKKLALNSDDCGTALGQVMDQLNRPSGRDLAIEAIGNAFKSVMMIVKDAKKAFHDFFPEASSVKLYNLIDKIDTEISLFMIDVEDNADKIQSTFKIIFSIAKLAAHVIGSVVTGALKLFNKFVDKSGGSILDTTAKIGDMMESFTNWVIENKIVTNTIKQLGEWIGKVIKIVVDFGKKISGVIVGMTKIKENAAKQIKTDGYKKLGDAFDTLKGKVKSAVDFILKHVSRLFGTIGKAFNTNNFTKIIVGVTNALNGLINVVSKVGSKVASVVGGAIKNASDWLNKLSFTKELKNIIKVSMMAGTAAGAIAKFKAAFEIKSGISEGKNGILAIFDKLKEFAESAKKVGDSIAKVLNTTCDVLVAWQKQIKAKTIRALAISILILAGSLFVISGLDGAKIAESLGAVTAMMVTMIGALAAMSKITQGEEIKGIKGALSGLIGMKKMTEGAKSLVLLAGAVLVLAIAMRVVAGLSIEDLVKGFVAITGLLYSLVGAALLLSNKSGDTQKGAGQLLLMAGAVQILGSVMKSLGKMSWDQMLVAAGGLISVMYALVGASLLMTHFTGDATEKYAGQLLVMAIAIRIIGGILTDLGKLSWDQMLIAVGGLVAVIGGMVGASLLLTHFTGDTEKYAAQLLIMAIACKLVGGVMMDFAELSWEKMAVAVVGLLAVLGGMVSASLLLSKFTGDKASTQGTVQLLVLAFAVAKVAKVMMKLAELDWASLGKGILGIGVVIGALVAALVILSSDKIDESAEKGAIAMIVIAAAISILGNAMIKMAKLSWGELVKGIVGLAGALLVMVIAGYAVSAVVGPLVALSAVMLAMGTAILGLGIGLSATAVALSILAQIGVDAAKDIAKSLAVFLETLSKSGQAILDFFVTILESLIKALLKAIPEILEFIGKLLVGIMQLLVKYIPKIVALVGELIVRVLDVIAQYTPKIIKTGWKILMSILKGIKKHIKDVVKTGIDIVLNLIDGVREKIPDILQEAADLIVSFIDGLADAIDKNTERIAKAAAKLIKALFNALVTASSVLLDSVIDIGKNIIKGINKGIKDVFGSVWKTLKKLLSGVIDNVKDLLGIKSPSRVFAEIGGYCGLGMAKGIKNSTADVVSASENMSKQSIEALKGTAAKIQNAIDGEMDSNPTITPVLDLSNIASGAGAINGMLANSSATLSAGNVSATLAARQANAATNADVVSAIDSLKDQISSGASGNTYNINGITYDDGSNVASAVSQLIRAATVERRA